MNSVFVSSTYDDLKEIRNDVINILLKLECFPNVMENFPASHKSSWETIKKYIDKSDYFILILAGRYGKPNSSIEPEKYDGMSYIEMEYRYALEKEKYIIPLLRDPNYIPSTMTDKYNDNLDKLKKELRLGNQDRHDMNCNDWTTSYNLCEKIQSGLHNAFKEAPSYKPNVFLERREIVDKIHKGLKERWNDAKEISILNLACQSMIAPEYSPRNLKGIANNVFKDQLEKGTNFNFILTNPHSYAAYDAAKWKIKGNHTHAWKLDHGSFEVIPSAVNKLAGEHMIVDYEDKKKRGDIDSRLVDFCIPYGMMIIEYKEKSGKSDMIKIDLYSYEHIDVYRPSFFVYKDTTPLLFKFYKNDFGRIWDGAQPIKIGHIYKTMDEKKTELSLREIFKSKDIYCED